MNFVRNVLCVGLFFSLTGCAGIRNILKQEVGYPGGVVENIADRKIFLASERYQRVSRYLISLAILAPLAADTANSSASASAVAIQINGAYRALNKMKKAAVRKPTPLLAGEISEYAFETTAYEMQQSLYGILSQVSANTGATSLAKNITKLNPIDLLKLFQKTKELFPVARRSIATYRDAVVLMSATMAAKCTPEDNGLGPCNRLKKFSGGTYDAEPSTNGRYVLRRVALAITEISKSEDFDWRMDLRGYHGIIYHIDQACEKLVLIQITDLEDESINCGQKMTQTTPNVAASSARAGFLEDLDTFASQGE